MIGHVLCMILAFAFITPVTAVAQALYIAILVSISRTLKTFIIYLYIIVAGINLVSGALSVVTLTTGFIWYALVLFYYFLAIKVIWTESGPYRSGSKSNNHNKG